MGDNDPDRTPYPSKAMIILRIALVPIVGLYALMFRTKRGKERFRAETARLAKQSEGEKAVVDRYLDSRDAADDDLPKEFMLTDDPMRDPPVAKQKPE